MKRNKKPLLLGVLAVLLVAFAVGGTLAWMTAQDSKVNTFTVGTFDNPTKDPETDDPDTGDDEDEKESDTENTDGFLTETAWTYDDKNQPQLIPGDPIAKNPNVGVGADSVDPYVFIFVKNNAVSDASTVAQYGPYFTIEHQWSAVTDNNFTEGDNASEVVTPTASIGAGALQSDYVDGLFMYTGDATDKTLPALLAVSSAADTVKNVYTGELFETITLPDGNAQGIKAENANVSVYAFIYGSKSGATGNEEGTAQAALDAAIQWAEDIKADPSK